MNVPYYKTVAGIALPQTKVVLNELQVCVQNTNENECYEYVRELENDGFIKQTENVIPAGSDKPYNKNLFFTLINEKMHLFIFFAASLRTTQIVAMPILPIPKEKKVYNNYLVKRPQTITQLKIKFGMCYIIEMSEGEFVIFDGGKYYPEDAERLYSFLTERTPCGKKPCIKMWLFSHPDIDHVGLATEFIRIYAEKLDILSFAHQFPDCDNVVTLGYDISAEKKNIENLLKNISVYFPGVSIYTLHTGQVYNFCGFNIEILLTSDIVYPYYYMSGNDFSCAWRVNFDNGKKALFLGDCMHYFCRQLSYMYGDYLKSDILQVTHHGLIGGEIGLYKTIDPEICFWSTVEERYLGKTENQKYQWCLGEGGCDYNRWLRDDTVRKRTHYNQSVTVTIEI